MSLQPSRLPVCRIARARDYVGADGCGRTLVFAEQTGLNLSIVVKPSEATPLNVNIGLDRTVASQCRRSTRTTLSGCSRRRGRQHVRRIQCGSL